MAQQPTAVLPESSSKKEIIINREYKRKATESERGWQEEGPRVVTDAKLNLVRKSSIIGVLNDC
jgi:hypothetical protein